MLVELKIKMIKNIRSPILGQTSGPFSPYLTPIVANSKWESVYTEDV